MILKTFIGVLGFEPRNNGVKVRCLTAWRYPIYHTNNISIKTKRYQAFSFFAMHLKF